MPTRQAGKTVAIAVGTVIVAAIAAFFYLAREPADFAGLRRDRDFNVVVITLDTLRADRLGAYGFDQVETPVIDGLARDGVLFRRAYSVTPLTLPAHTSLFSGTYPPYHGVRDNGGFTVPEELTTMGEIFSDRGYDTGAFVAAFVLDARWGLDQGFDTYVDDFDVSGQRFISMGRVQRPANEVVDAALEWIERERSAPFFLWVHLYDPHAPYEAPEPYRSRYPDAPYLAEIAFTDAQVGRLVAGLESSGANDETLIVLAGDHGESLGEHGEVQHGFFIYEEATHVPLIFSTPFEQFHGVERSEVVSLVDVLPTVLEVSGLEAPAQVQGRSLAPLFRAESDGAEGGETEAHVVYSESFYPRFHYGWSELTAVQDERYKLILSPDPELYDLREDPDESINLVQRERAQFDRLEAAADELVAASAGGPGTEFMAVDEETLARLASLGYVGSFPTTGDDPEEELASPRGKIGIYNKSIRARSLMQTEQYEEAETLLREILEEDQVVLDAYQTLGQLYTLQERFADAADVYRSAIPLKPDDPHAHINLIEAQLKLGRVEEAERAALDSFEFVETDPHILYLLGNIRRMQTRYAEAIDYYEQCLDLRPESAAAFSGLAGAYFDLENLPEAEAHARRALEINDEVPSMHFLLARIHEERGDPQQAAAEYLREIEISPEDIGSHFNLAMIYRVAGRAAEEERYLTRVLEIDPGYPRGLLFMARIRMNRGDDYAAIVETVEAAVEAPLETQDRAFGYFLLADLYSRLGDAGKAREYAARAQSLISGD